jgi:hypothetical protein
MSHIRQQLPPAKKQDTDLTPAKAGQTEKFVLCFTTELKARIKQESKNMFGQRKGACSLYVEQALRIHFHMNVEGVTER